MRKLIIVSHGELAASFLSSLRMIAGGIKDNEYAALGFQPNESLDNFTLRLEKAVKEFDPANNEIWILSDIESGTPYNAAYLLSKKYPLKIIYGFNLSLLLELSFRKDTLTEPELKQLIEDSRKTLGLKEDEK